MAILKSKGTIFQYSISSTLTAVPQIVSIDKSGEGSETMDVRALDSAVGLPMAATGFVKSCEITLDVLFDSTSASVHRSILADMRTPTMGVVTKLTRTDAGPSAEAWTTAGISFDESMEGSKPIGGKFKFTMTGSPSLTS